MSARESGREALRAFVVEHARGADAKGLTDTTPLVSSGLLSSLDVVELLVLVERLTGAPVDVSQLGPGDFRDVDTICRRFLEAGRGVASPGAA